MATVKLPADAMDLLITESRTNGRFEDPKLVRADLPREYAAQVHGIERVVLEMAITGAASAMIAERDDAQSAEPVAMRLGIYSS